VEPASLSRVGTKDFDRHIRGIRSEDRGASPRIVLARDDNRPGGSDASQDGRPRAWPDGAVELDGAGFIPFGDLAHAC
jgi:hypothetical protein